MKDAQLHTEQMRTQEVVLVRRLRWLIGASTAVALATGGWALWHIGSHLLVQAGQ